MKILSFFFFDWARTVDALFMCVIKAKRLYFLRLREKCWRIQRCKMQYFVAWFTLAFFLFILFVIFPVVFDFLHRKKKAPANKMYNNIISFQRSFLLSHNLSYRS